MPFPEGGLRIPQSISRAGHFLSKAFGVDDYRIARDYHEMQSDDIAYARAVGGLHFIIRFSVPTFKRSFEYFERIQRTGWPELALTVGGLAVDTGVLAGSIFLAMGGHPIEGGVIKGGYNIVVEAFPDVLRSIRRSSPTTLAV